MLKVGDCVTVAGVYAKRPWWAFWRKRKLAVFTVTSDNIATHRT
jgi:hypothetical protein